MSTIMIADDAEDNLVLFTRFLERLGHTVVPARNGQEVLRLVEQAIPDLILMDLSMPFLNGWLTTKQLKSQPHTAHIPVIAFTAHAMNGDREQALAAGCDGYLAKPVEFSSLITTLARYVAHCTP